MMVHSLAAGHGASVQSAREEERLFKGVFIILLISLVPVFRNDESTGFFSSKIMTKRKKCKHRKMVNSHVYLDVSSNNQLGQNVKLKSHKPTLIFMWEKNPPNTTVKLSIQDFKPQPTYETNQSSSVYNK